MVYDQNPSYASYGTQPSADLDLQIVSPGSALVAASVSFDNTYEIVDFTATTAGNYTMRVSRLRCDLTPAAVGWAWWRSQRNVGVVVAPAGAPAGVKTLSATLTARWGCGTIDHIQFGVPGVPFDNARVSISTPGGGPSNQTLGFTYTPPAGTQSVVLTFQRVVQAGGATVNPIRFYDGCGEWRTFVGGGPRAW
jgi:hypothetical protein